VPERLHLSSLLAGVYPAMFERLLSLAGTLLSHGIERGYRVGLISNGCLSNSDQTFRVPPGRSPNQLGRLLQALAAATPVVVASFERFLLREVRTFRLGPHSWC